MAASAFRVEDVLGDGTPVTFRQAVPADAPLYVKAFAALDPTSIYTRFFGFKSELTEADLAHLAIQDFAEEAILVATVRDGSGEVIVGSSRYVATGGGSAEVAFIVEEDYQGQGIAHRLLEHLAGIARGQGLDVFEAFVLPENRSMLAVFAHCGFGVRQRREDGAVHVWLSLTRAGPGP
jgi:GNAT superfamily N-acetyltransferase